RRSCRTVGSPTGSATGETAGDDLLVVLLLDNIWLTPGDRRRILPDLDRFLLSQPVGARFVVASLGNGLELLTPVTRDRETLRPALSDLLEPPLHGLQASLDRRSAYRDSAPPRSA
ncbi:MAG: hypothetical protein OES32_00500, partial [Acidobacteriota bacterium]|nr:hypothetical protein [Acidobacteriota bacterium]